MLCALCRARQIVATGDQIKRRLVPWFQASQARLELEFWVIRLCFACIMHRLDMRTLTTHGLVDYVTPSAVGPHTTAKRLYSTVMAMLPYAACCLCFLPS
jgi:hypothetical protein